MIGKLQRPQVLLEVDGVPLTAEDTRTLQAVRVQQRLSLPTLCELVFVDPAMPYSALALLAPGAALRVAVRGHADALFTGEVTALEYVYDATHGQQLRVRGYDLLHRLRQRQSVRAHVQVTASDLAQELVADLGLVVEASAPGPLWQRLIQHRQSDLELLVEVTERCGLHLALRDNVLHLLTLDGIGSPFPLALGETLLEARIEVNEVGTCQSVATTGWDPSRVEVHTGTALRARVGRMISNVPAPGGEHGAAERTLVDEAAQDTTHAEALAQAELDGRAARKVTFWGIAEGDPRLRPGAIVEVMGVAPALAGAYVLTGAIHTIDDLQGYVAELSTTPLPSSRRARGAVATPAVVTQIDDPEQLGRVRVALSTYGDVETDWMGVLSVGAGKGKGLTALPDIGDQVLVLLAHEDPGQGVVLGGLYGGEGPPDSGVDGGAVRRYTLLTPGGQRVQLDDARNLIRLENRDGSYVELAPTKVLLHAEADLMIEAPGYGVVIRGKRIDFERAE